MPINLEKPATDVDPSAPEYSAMLHALQANILKPHGRNFARHLFLQFTAAPALVATWIREQIAPVVTTQWDEYHAPPGDVDAGPVFGFFLSAGGYRRLGLNTDTFASEA